MSTERASGWSRQLRLTPLKPIAYITAKAIVGMLISALAIGAVYACGPLRHAQMPTKVWLSSALIIWLGSLVFVAFGLFVGYLLPSDNAMQVVGPAHGPARLPRRHVHPVDTGAPPWIASAASRPCTGCTTWRCGPWAQRASPGGGWSTC